VFRSFPLCLCGAGHRQLKATLNGNPKGRTTLKMGFPFASGYLPRQKFIWSEDLLFSFFFPLLIGNYSVFLRSFPFLLSFDRESFFSFSFLSFHSFFLFLFIFF